MNSLKRNKYNITQEEIENKIKEWEEYLKENEEEVG